MDENERIKGAEIAAEILKKLEPEHRERLVEAIVSKDPQIATEIVAAMSGSPIPHQPQVSAAPRQRRLSDQIEIERGEDLSELILKQEEEISIATGSYEEESDRAPTYKGLKRRIA